MMQPDFGNAASNSAVSSQPFCLRSDSELILQAIDEGFVLLDPDFRVRHINDEALRIDGRPRSAILGRTHWEVWPGSEALPIADAYRRAMRERVPVCIEQLYRHNGAGMWIEARAFPFRDSLAVFYRDITQRKLAERALRDTQARLNAALTAAEIGTWTWDIPADRVHADPNLAAMFGIAQDDADGMSIETYFNAIHPDDIGAVRAGINRSVATGEPYHEHFRMPDAGGMRYMQARGIALTGDDGRACRMSGVVLDVTRQQLAEEALKSSEATFRTLAENIPQLAWMADSDGDIFWYNNRWFEYTGATLEEMRGWGWAKVHHPDHVDRVVALYRKQIVEEQRVWEDTFPLRGADGQYRWFLSRAMPIRDQDGYVMRWLGTNTDITLQREAEQALQQANQRKDEFLAMLAHELRNPLAPISTAAQLLKMGAHNPGYIKRSSDIIERQVRHLSDLVNDLMDVSRVTRGLASIKQEDVDVVSAVHNAVEQSRPLIEARRQELALDICEGGACVLGDRTRLVQVVANLLNNAAKYTPPGGRIELTLFKTAAHGGEVEIIVADNGIGMDAALLPHVFELFTQAERTPDRSEGGLGLGLALVKSIVALHHGHITACSAGRGMGSTFRVTLPAAVPAPGPAAGAWAGPLHGAVAQAKPPAHLPPA